MCNIFCTFLLSVCWIYSDVAGDITKREVSFADGPILRDPNDVKYQLLAQDQAVADKVPDSESVHIHNDINDISTGNNALRKRVGLVPIVQDTINKYFENMNYKVIEHHNVYTIKRIKLPISLETITYGKDDPFVWDRRSSYYFYNCTVVYKHLTVVLGVDCIKFYPRGGGLYWANPTVKKYQSFANTSYVPDDDDDNDYDLYPLFVKKQVTRGHTDYIKFRVTEVGDKNLQDKVCNTKVYERAGKKPKVYKAKCGFAKN